MSGSIFLVPGFSFKFVRAGFLCSTSIRRFTDHNGVARSALEHVGFIALGAVLVGFLPIAIVVGMIGRRTVHRVCS